MKPAFIPPTGSVVPVWPGTPPGSEMWTWTEQELLLDGDRMVRNVSVPTLEVFAPTGEPNGTAVIVAPGGAYQLLMVDHEGIGAGQVAGGPWRCGLRAPLPHRAYARGRWRDGPLSPRARRARPHDAVERRPARDHRGGSRARQGPGGRGRPPGNSPPPCACRRVGRRPRTRRYRRLLGGGVGSYGGRCLPRCRQPTELRGAHLRRKAR